jgi:hypothetical protein
LSSPTTSGMFTSSWLDMPGLIWLTQCRLLDKIAKQILVCDNKTIQQWDGTIGEYKNHLRKKMLAAGAV